MLLGCASDPADPNFNIEPSLDASGLDATSDGDVVQGPQDAGFDAADAWDAPSSDSADSALEAAPDSSADAPPDNDAPVDSVAPDAPVDAPPDTPEPPDVHDDPPVDVPDVIDAELPDADVSDAVDAAPDVVVLPDVAAEAPPADAPEEPDVAVDVAPADTSEDPAPDVEPDAAHDVAQEAEAAPEAALDTGPGACSWDECEIEGVCIEAGTPSDSSPCLACLPFVERFLWSADSHNVTCLNVPYWQGASRHIATTPYGHRTAVAYHNAYSMGGQQPSNTLSIIHDAQKAGADIIELDVKDEGGTLYVDHDDAGSTWGAKLKDVLADTALRDGDQLLFIEFKERTPTASFASRLLVQLETYGYATPERPVVLRAFTHDERGENLLLARSLLATQRFALLRPHIRLHASYPRASGTTLQALVLDAWSNGFHGVDFEYQSWVLFSALTFARHLGLGVSVYTMPVSSAAQHLSAMRDEVDAVICDGSMSAARDIVTAQNAVMYVNAWNQNIPSPELLWLAEDPTEHWADMTVALAPNMVSFPQGKQLFGNALQFDAGAHLATYDGDNDSDGGYVVSVVGVVDDINPSDGSRRVMLSKAGPGGFVVDLFNPPGNGNDTVLRFGVDVAGTYQYATSPANNLSKSASVQVTGAYGGNGLIRLWVDQSGSSSTASGPLTGGISQNDIPITLGAEFEGDDASSFFVGRIQLALVQRWNGN